jgi:hypothetical protein
VRGLRWRGLAGRWGRGRIISTATTPGVPTIGGRCGYARGKLVRRWRKWVRLLEREAGGPGRRRRLTGCDGASSASNGLRGVGAYFARGLCSSYPSDYSAVIVWCETFSQFITAAEYRARLAS